MKKIVLLNLLLFTVSCSQDNGSAPNPSLTGSAFQCDYKSEGSGDPNYCMLKACKASGGYQNTVNGITECKCADGVFVIGKSPACVSYNKIQSSCTVTRTEDSDVKVCSISLQHEKNLYATYFNVDKNFLPSNRFDRLEQILAHNLYQSGYSYVKVSDERIHNRGYEVRPNSDLTLFNFISNEIVNLASIKKDTNPNPNPNMMFSYNPYVYYYSTKDIRSLELASTNTNKPIVNNLLPNSLKAYQADTATLLSIVKTAQYRTQHENLFEPVQEWSTIQANKPLGCYINCTLARLVNPNKVGQYNLPNIKQLTHVENGYVVRHEWILRSKINNTVIIAVTSKENSLSYLVLVHEDNTGLLINNDLEVVDTIEKIQVNASAIL
ncbi:MAG: hypothetical protein KDD37_04035 [Bdellovibrionales bacterium]|nr:hypothetical protein [Bdellovibrionales bacterium]